jgi:hypothetical protein
MTKPKTKYPIESFGPQLMQALIRGGREKVVIPFPGENGDGKRKAHSFQRRIHTLRSRMRQEEHPDYMIATRAKVSIMWGEKATEYGHPEWKDDDQGQRGALIVIRPQDSEFEDELAKMVVSDLDEVLAPAPVIQPSSAGIEDLLSELDEPKSEV